MNDFKAKDIYTAVGRPDLAPKKEMVIAFIGMDLQTTKKCLEDIRNSWNGKESWFFHEGERFHEDDVSAAEEIIKKIDELQELLNDFNS